MDSAGSGSRVQSIFSLAQDAFYTGERREGDLTDGCSCSSHHLTPDWDSGIRELNILDSHQAGKGKTTKEW